MIKWFIKTDISRKDPSCPVVVLTSENPLVVPSSAWNSVGERNAINFILACHHNPPLRIFSSFPSSPPFSVPPPYVFLSSFFLLIFGSSGGYISIFKFYITYLLFVLMRLWSVCQNSLFKFIISSTALLTCSSVLLILTSIIQYAQSYPLKS